LDFGHQHTSRLSPRANDIRGLLEECEIQEIYCNGRKSHEMYEKYILPALGREAACLPSTSPANAAWSLEKLIAAWSVIKE
jgi:G:T/U-mismatch repair DNA glycosylase